MSAGRQEPLSLSGGDDATLAAIVRLRGEPLIEALDEHLAGSADHAEGTGAYAFAAAAGIGLGREAAGLCREVAKLHEIGKVYVPADLLRRRPEELGARERAEFEAHAESGARLALGAGIPEVVCTWMLQIRERYDGAGPDGLTGEAIPAASRIARAACACDRALAAATGDTGTRVGRAQAELLAHAGGELDPAVVDPLAGILSRISA